MILTQHSGNDSHNNLTTMDAIYEARGFFTLVEKYNNYHTKQQELQNLELEPEGREVTLKASLTLTLI